MAKMRKRSSTKRPGIPPNYAATREIGVTGAPLSMASHIPTVKETEKVSGRVLPLGDRYLNIGPDTFESARPSFPPCAEPMDFVRLSGSRCYAVIA
jgi:hypothetical protein